MQTLRLMKEYQAIRKEAATDVSLVPVDEDYLTRWTAIINGPPSTPFEGGKFTLDIQIPSQYPLEPPLVQFKTKIFHPNIHWKSGEICLDLLKSSWSASYTLMAVCRSVIVLLEQPAPDSPLNCDCGNLLRCGDIRGYNSMARMFTNLHAQIQESEPK